MVNIQGKMVLVEDKYLLKIKDLVHGINSDTMYTLASATTSELKKYQVVEDIMHNYIKPKRDILNAHYAQIKLGKFKLRPTILEKMVAEARVLECELRYVGEDMLYCFKKILQNSSDYCIGFKILCNMSVGLIIRYMGETDQSADRVYHFREALDFYLEAFELTRNKYYSNSYNILELISAISDLYFNYIHEPTEGYEFCINALKVEERFVTNGHLSNNQNLLDLIGKGMEQIERKYRLASKR